MSAANTLNICLGHESFPEEHQHFVDIMLAPQPIDGHAQVIVVEDSYHGAHGSALSEYAQLMWLSDHFDELTAGYEYVRVFHHRRFVAARPIGKPSDIAFARWIPPYDVGLFPEAFDRHCTAELIDQPFDLKGGMLVQFAANHVLEDMLNFARFLNANNILDAVQTAHFLQSQTFIPSSNIGVFRVENHKKLLSMLRLASRFVESDSFVPRTGYQRRSAGFLLERFNSYLLQFFVTIGSMDRNSGYQIVLSDGPTIGTTTKTG